MARPVSDEDPLLVLLGDKRTWAEVDRRMVAAGGEPGEDSSAVPGLPDPLR